MGMGLYRGGCLCHVVITLVLGVGRKVLDNNYLYCKVSPAPILIEHSY